MSKLEAKILYDDKPLQEACGIAAAITNHKGNDVSNIVAEVAFELQHRGQEGAGMGRKRLGGDFAVYRTSQPFEEAFSAPRVLDTQGLRGEIVLAHTRYRTTGPADDSKYAQPMDIQVGRCRLLGIHNGNLVNAQEVYEDLSSKGVRFETEGMVDKEGKPVPVSDSETLFRKLAYTPGCSWPEKIARAMEDLQGSISAVVATDSDELIAFRDPWGIRPLNFGRFNGHWVVSSETMPLDNIGVYDQTEIQKGEMWVFKSGKDPERIVYDDSKPKKYCDFEDWYFSWPSSERNGIEATLIREACGTVLAEEEIASGRLVKADLVTGVPDTGRTGAEAFAARLGIQHYDRIYKARYGKKGFRGFMGSDELLRARMMDRKYRYSKTVRDKVIYVNDDTGVRLETIKYIVRALKSDRLGAKEVHVRFNAPKFIRPCFLGVNINDREELKAIHKVNGLWVRKNDCQIADEIGADSVAYLSMEGRRRVREMFGERAEDFCGYCHGDSGPTNINWLKFDPELRNEQIA